MKLLGVCRVNLSFDQFAFVSIPRKIVWQNKTSISLKLNVKLYSLIFTWLSFIEYAADNMQQLRNPLKYNPKTAWICIFYEICERENKNNDEINRCKQKRTTNFLRDSFIKID